MLDAKVVGSVLQRLREERGLSLETFYRIGEALHMRPSAVLAEIEAELERNT